jgi:diguanylate cyclase (GGDEF)-like protein/PAS domain S-box-containing protein
VRERTDRGVEDGTLLVDFGGRIRFCSPGAAALFRCHPDDTLGHPAQALLPALPLRTASVAHNVAYATAWFARPERRRFHGCDVHGRAFDVDVELRSLTLQDLRGLVLVLHRSPRSGAADLQRLVEALAQRDTAHALVDAHGAIVTVNCAFATLTGHDATTATGRPLSELLDEAPAEDTDGALDVARGDGRTLSVGRRRDGTPFHCLSGARPFVDALGRVTHHVVELRDVSAQVRAIERLRFLATHDGLTGLPARSLFLDRLQHEVARATRAGSSFAVLCLDVDRFKAVNDRLGHATGDAVLRVVADRLRQGTRGVDTVARLGGDEFAVILAGVATRADAEVVVRKLVASLNAPAMCDGANLTASASIGVAMYPDDGRDQATLLRAADAAMYRAKAAQGNGYRFTAEAPDAAA